MEEVVVDGKRCDNGQFTKGTFNLLLSKMKERFPDAVLDIKHLRNKHKRLKDKYNYVQEMLNYSGFGWDDEKKMVEVASPEVLETWSKNHGVTLYTPGRPFSQFERLSRIFGKDRANGGYAVQGNEVEQDSHINNTEPLLSEDGFTDFAETEDSTLPTPPANASSSDAHQGRNKRPKKCLDTDLFGQLVDSVKAAQDNQGKQVQIIANAVSGVNEEVNLSKTLKALGYNSQEIVRIAVKFTQNPELKMTFWSLDEERKAFVDEVMRN